MDRTNWRWLAADHPFACVTLSSGLAAAEDSTRPDQIRTYAERNGTPDAVRLSIQTRAAMVPWPGNSVSSASLGPHSTILKQPW